MDQHIDITLLKVPVSTQKEFAKDVGLTLSAVRNQVNRGYLPTIKIGRHRMINLVELTRMCIKAAASNQAN